MNHSVDYYDRHAAQFFEHSHAVNMQPIYTPFLKYIPAQGRILDLGCGSGRDALAFKNMAYTVEASDYSRELVEKARQHTGLNVRYESFYDLAEHEQYDGIWACASLLHCERSRLVEVLTRIITALKDQAVCYLSFKYGDQDRNQAGRYFTDLNEAQFAQVLSSIPHTHLLQQWITQDQRPDRSEQWLNIIVQKKIPKTIPKTTQKIIQKHEGTT